MKAWTQRVTDASVPTTLSFRIKRLRAMASSSAFVPLNESGEAAAAAGVVAAFFFAFVSDADVEARARFGILYLIVQRSAEGGGGGGASEPQETF
jgi:hypothetical protein|tara:strand:- start:153 stop:437 length:285 start_codon:yes stop_codon:yes gene_type:complete